MVKKICRGFILAVVVLTFGSINAQTGISKMGITVERVEIIPHQIKAGEKVKLTAYLWTEEDVATARMRLYVYSHKLPADAKEAMIATGWGYHAKSKTMIKEFLQEINGGSVKNPCKAEILLDTTGWPEGNYKIYFQVVSAHKGDRTIYPWVGGVSALLSVKGKLTLDEVKDKEFKDGAVARKKIVSESLVACWLFREGKGEIVKDSSGVGNDGILHNVKWVKLASGEFALNFSGNNSYVDCGSDDTLMPTEELTVEAWVKWAGPVGKHWGTVVGKRGGNSGYMLTITPGGSPLFNINGLHGKNDPDMSSIISRKKVEIGKWTHLVGIYDKKNKKIGIYVNGEGTTTHSKIMHPSKTKLALGVQNANYFWHWFKGEIGEVRIYRVALSKEQIMENFQEGAVKYGIDLEKIALEKKGYIIWRKNPLVHLTPDTRPPEPFEELKTINLSCYINESRPVSIVLKNVTDRTIEVRILVSKLVDKKTQNFISPDTVTIRVPRLIRVSTSRDYKVAKGGSTIIADPLPLINEANIVTLPPDRPTEIYFIFNTKDIPAGFYEGDITFYPLCGEPKKKIKLNITVYPILLPDEMPVKVYVLAGMITLRLDIEKNREVVEKYMDDLRSHGVNTIEPFVWGGWIPYPEFDKDGKMVEPLNKTTLKKFDTWMRFFIQQPWLKMILINPNIHGYRCSALRKIGGPHKPLTPEWEKCFRVWFKAFIEHIKNLGLNYDQFALYIYDETNKEKVLDELLKVGRLMKDIDPEVKIWVTACGSTPTKFIERYRSLVDIVVPRAPVPWHWDKKWDGLWDPKRCKAAQPVKDGQELWFYQFYCAKGVYTDPFTTFRRGQGWYAWKYKIDGFGFWEYMPQWNIGKRWDCQGDPWDDFDAPRADLGVVYDNIYWPKGPIPSRRWEAFREGITDYLYLYLLDKEIKQAKAKGIDVTSAENLLRKFNEDIFYDRNPNRIYEFREKIGQETVKLKLQIENCSHLPGK